MTPSLPPSAPLVVIAGPTAGGKSALGIHLARELGGEVLACDSTQVYRGFDIGTGKVTAEEAAGVPHHLIDLCGPLEAFTAGDYMRVGRTTLAEVSGRGRLPIVTAGTGLYLRALLEGLAPLPKQSEVLRARLQTKLDEGGAGRLHAMLARIDPESAREIAPQDGSKLLRALEICFLTHKPRSEFFREGREPLTGYRVLKICLGPERAELYRRIELRVQKMLEAGWREEVRELLKRFPAEVKPFGFLGYKQLAGHLREEMSLDEAVARIQHETRQYSRRQMTWFHKEAGAEWVPGFGDDNLTQENALTRIKQFLGQG